MTAADSGRRRFFIGIALPFAQTMGLDTLECASNDVERLSRWLTEKQGYTRVLAERIPGDATANVVRRELSAWFGHPDRRTSDVVVVYVAAHGGQLGRSNRHHILAIDSDPRQPTHSAIQTAQLSYLFLDGEGARPQNILLILDTCDAGRGSGSVAAVVQEAKADLLDAEGPGLWIVASTAPTADAFDGEFVTALLDAVDDPDVSPTGGTPFINPLALVEHANQRLRDAGVQQQAEIDATGIGRTSAPFFVNRRFTRQRDGAPLADEAHWSPKARGVDHLSSEGWFFTGRRAARARLVNFLTAPPPAGRPIVVTGRPGSGKSAVLGWLVLTSSREKRDLMMQSGVPLPPDLTPPPGSVDVAIHARGLSPAQGLSLLAQRFAVQGDDFAALTRRLQERATPACIVVDAVDEATEPDRWQRELLLPLAECREVRLIVGSRRLADGPPLGARAEVIDLDSPEFFDGRDLDEYAYARLRSAPAGTTPAIAPDDAHQITTEIAKKAGGSFLYARVVTRQIVEAAGPVDVQTLRLPDGMRDAFDDDLQRFGEKRRWVEDLLVPLAYSRGKGLPQKTIWSQLASAIAGVSYTNTDLRELKRVAGYYIVQDTEADEVVFRLFHQEFADYLVAKTAFEDVERQITESLWNLDAPPRGRGTWLRRAEPYIGNYLASHAAAGGVLSHLLRDPLFLRKVTPDSLIPHLWRASSTPEAPIARAFRAASGAMRGKSESEAMAYLCLALLQHGQEATAAALMPTAASNVWSPLWARWTLRAPHQAIAQGPSEITALALGEWQPGQPVALVGRRDGTVEVWDLATDTRLAAWHPDGVEWVNHVAFCHNKSGRFLVATWAPDRVGTFDIASDVAKLRHLTADVEGTEEEQSIPTALLVASIDGQDVCVVATRGGRLTVLSLPELGVVSDMPSATDAPVLGLAITRVDSEAVLVLVGDSISADRHVRTASRIRMRSWPELKPLWGDDRPAHGTLVDVEVSRLYGRDVVVATADSGTPSEVWDLSQRFLLLSSRKSPLRSWIHEYRGTTALVDLEGWEMTVSGVTQEADGAFSLKTTLPPIRIEGSLFSSRTRLYDRWVFVSATWNRLHVWDIDELIDGADAEASEVSLLEVHSLASSISSSHLVAGVRGAIVELDVSTGTTRRSWTVESGARVRALSAFVDGRAPCVIAGDSDGHLHVVDLRSGSSTRLRAGDDIQVTVTGSHAHKVFAFVSVDAGGTWAVRVWDLEARTEVETPGWGFGQPWRYVLSTGGQDKRIYGLACVEAADAIRFAFASKYGQVMVARHPPADDPMAEDFDTWGLPTSPGGYTGALAAVTTRRCDLLAAGTDAGLLALWDFASGRRIAHRVGAHVGPIRSLAFSLDGAALLASAGDDGVVRLWSDELKALTHIDLNEGVTALTWHGEGRLVIGTRRGAVMIRFDIARLRRLAKSQ
jgi:WD40 repeat protein